jgi:Fe-S cluster assembly protein SufD
MSIVEKYRIEPEWQHLARPLLREPTEGGSDENGWARTLHALAREQFRAARMPDRKTEDWKYTPLRPLTTLELNQPPAWEGDVHEFDAYRVMIDATHVVFINGHFIPGLSDAMPDEIWAGPLHDLQFGLGQSRMFQDYTALLASVQMTPFEALVTAIPENGICIAIPSNVQVARPLHLVYIQSDDQVENPYVHPFTLFLVGKHARVSVVESYYGGNTEGTSVTNTVNHITLDKGSQVRHYRMQAENRDSYHISATRVFQEQDTEYTQFAVETGGKLMRNNIEVTHLGTNVTTNLYGIFKGVGKQHLDTQSFIDHAHPHCNSNELYKGVLDDYARGVFNGKILVRPDAQKTNAYQQNSTLVLSPDAVMDSKPQLEIFADDVRCSHGATIGQLDEDAVFYLRSRGLTKEAATAMLQHAFIGEVLDLCKDEPIKTYLEQHLSAKRYV